MTLTSSGSEVNIGRIVDSANFSYFRCMRLLAIPLLLIMLLQAGGLMLICTVQRELVQAEMQRELNRPDAEVKKLVLSRKEYAAAKLNHFEIRHEGKMYDVRSRIFEDGRVLLEVIHDEKEESLFREIKKLVMHHDTHDTKLPKALKVLSGAYYTTAAKITIDPRVQYLSKEGFLLERKYPEDILMKVTSPPPEEFPFFKSVYS